MRYAITCKTCGDSIWIRGEEDPSTNGFDLNDNDPRWDDACEHIKAGGDYDIGESEALDED